MNKKHLTYLKKKYKFIKGLKEIVCGDGWKDIVYNMCKEIEDSNPPVDFVITHIGERFGGLDVHTKNGAMRIRVIIDEYNTQSIELCDACGNPRDLDKCTKCVAPVIIQPILEKQVETTTSDQE